MATTPNLSLSSMELNSSEVEFSEVARRDALYIVIPITVIYVIIFFTGLIGNVATCIVIARNKSMHTATNYYLFSLAISDLLLLISGLPAEIYLIWSRYPYVFGYTFCVLRGLFAETSMNATVLTIAAFTIERYVAICHPFLSHTMSKLSRVVKLILFIWTVAVCFAIPQATQFTLIKLYTDPDNDDVICYVENPIRYTFEISTFFFFVLPMTLIAVLYALIGLQLRSSSMMKRNSTPASAGLNGNAYQHPQGSVRTNSKSNCRHQQSQSSRRVLKMLVAVVVAFFICWAPFHTQRLLATYLPPDTQSGIFDAVTYVSGVLYFMSTTINPLLYNIMSNKFREAFKETFARCCRLARFKSGGTHRPQRTYSVLSRSAQRGGGGSCSGGGGGGHESSESYKDDHSLHTNSTVTTHYKASIDPISLQQQCSSMKRKESLHEKHVFVTTGRHWQKDRREICLTMVPKTNLDNITPSTRLVAVSVARRPSSVSRMERVWRMLACTNPSVDGSFSSIYSTPAKENPEEQGGVCTASVPGLDDRCDISNSSLRDVEMGELVDELSAYMEEIKTRELST